MRSVWSVWCFARPATSCPCLSGVCGVLFLRFLCILVTDLEGALQLCNSLSQPSSKSPESPQGLQNCLCCRNKWSGSTVALTDLLSRPAVQSLIFRIFRILHLVSRSRQVTPGRPRAEPGRLCTLASDASKSKLRGTALKTGVSTASGQGCTGVDYVDFLKPKCSHKIDMSPTKL